MTEHDQETLVRVGSGTPMGDLLRRYWQPVAAAVELDERPTKRMRLLGEDLVVFRHAQGYAVVGERCPHRGTSLAHGICEPDGIRWSNGAFQHADAIIWATGFRPELRHLAPLKLREKAGGVTVGVVSSDTTAYIGANTRVNQDRTGVGAGQAVNVAAVNNFEVLSVGGGAGGGFAGVGGGVDVGVVRNNTAAYIQAGASVSASVGIEVHALAAKDIDSAAFSAAGGVVLAEAKGSCAVYGMPRCVIEAGLAAAAVRLEAMADAMLARL